MEEPLAELRTGKPGLVLQGLLGAGVLHSFGVPCYKFEGAREVAEGALGYQACHPGTCRVGRR